ncbi:MAG TPA: hypothetical protein DHW01_00910 [Rhodobacter sp.]|nr:MAG: hypothetical protein ABR97_05810 [Rhodobacter sp. BACL10 MAG-120419-bin15]HCK06790.1 hypothetical protein [Rhodobacter sp.]
MKILLKLAPTKGLSSPSGSTWFNVKFILFFYIFHRMMSLMKIGVNQVHIAFVRAFALKAHGLLLLTLL